MSAITIELDEPTSARLDGYARRTGRTVEAVATEAVDRLLSSDAIVGVTPPTRAVEGEDWRENWRSIRGMWKDRDDLDELYAQIRREANRVVPPERPL